MNAVTEYTRAVPAAATGIEVAVQSARAEDEPRLLLTLTSAFFNDPPTRWLYPDLTHYLRNYPQFARAFAGAAVRTGTAFYADGFAGCALWFPPETGAAEEELFEVIAHSVPAHRHEEVFALFEAMDAAHPHEPHWYLPLIGVDAAFQGWGLGSTLLRNILDRCDRERIPAYLEATTPRNIALYERHGFRCLEPLRVNTCPPITPMWRRPGVTSR